jgi:hypothetical protein
MQPLRDRYLLIGFFDIAHCAPQGSAETANRLPTAKTETSLDVRLFPFFLSTNRG